MASGDLSRPMNQKSRVHRRDSTVADMPAPLEFLENMTFRSGTNYSQTGLHALRIPRDQGCNVGRAGTSQLFLQVQKEALVGREGFDEFLYVLGIFNAVLHSV